MNRAGTDTPWGPAVPLPPHHSQLADALADGERRIAVDLVRPATVHDLVNWSRVYHDSYDYVVSYLSTFLIAQDLDQELSDTVLRSLLNAHYFTDGVTIHASSLGSMMALIGTNRADDFVLDRLCQCTGTLLLNSSSQLESSLERGVTTPAEESGAVDALLNLTGLTLMILNEADFKLGQFETVLNRLLHRAKRFDASLPVLSTPVFQQLISMGMKVDEA